MESRLFLFVFVCCRPPVRVVCAMMIAYYGRDNGLVTRTVPWVSKQYFNIRSELLAFGRLVRVRVCVCVFRLLSVRWLEMRIELHSISDSAET